MNECSAQQMTWEDAEASKKILLSFAGSGMRVCAYFGKFGTVTFVRHGHFNSQLDKDMQ